MKMIKRLPFCGTVMGISKDEFPKDPQQEILEEIELINYHRRAKIRMKGFF